MSELLKSPLDFTERVNDRFRPKNKQLPGYGMGWGNTEHIRFTPHEMSLWSGFNGHGKSLFLNQVALHAILGPVQERVAIASFELIADRNLYRLCRQAFGTKLPTESQIGEFLMFLDSRLFIYDFVGAAAMKKMMDTFRYAVECCGVTTFIVDSLMKLGMAEDDFAGQKKLVEELHNFVLETGCHVHLVAHSKKAEDETKIPSKFDVMGAGGITNIPDNGFTVWRNKKKEAHMHECEVMGKMPKQEFIDSPDAILECWKSREYGSDAEKRYAFWYSNEGMQYLDNQHAEASCLFGAEEVPFL